MPRKTRVEEGLVSRGLLASMRPRPDAAENRAPQAAQVAAQQRFNEAAARCRGKPQTIRYTTEDRNACFNEAAARCRGKRLRGGASASRAVRFNEAAARCRGKLWLATMV